jgi:hypothetical protein
MKLTAFFWVLVTGLFIQLSCSKTGDTIPPPPPPDPCLSKTINLGGTVVNPSVTGALDGSITLSATGGNYFTFSMNGGAFQASTVFNNLGAGNYTVMTRNADGCTASISFVLTNPVFQCNGLNIVVTANSTTNIPCEANSAVITVSAAGGIGPYTYSLNSGVFQAANSFSGLATGSYSITAKDANGCTGSASITVGNQVAGPLFTQVKALINYNCLYCHGGTFTQGGIDFSADCNIVSNKLRIKARSVDGNPSPMPVTGLLPAAERQKIIDWINAGGTFAN